MAMAAAGCGGSSGRHVSGAEQSRLCSGTRAAAKQLAAEVPDEMLQHMSDADIAPAAPLYVLARFGKWDEILAQPMPAAGLFYMQGLWHYARGLAFSAKRQVGDADRELQALRQAIDATPAERTYAGYFKTRDMLSLAANVLAGHGSDGTSAPLRVHDRLNPSPASARLGKRVASPMCSAASWSSEMLLRNPARRSGCGAAVR